MFHSKRFRTSARKARSKQKVADDLSQIAAESSKPDSFKQLAIDPNVPSLFTAC
jgi:hypothetical protein